MQKSVQIAKRTIDLSISGSRTVCKIRVSGHSLPLLPGEYRINNPFCTHLPLPERSRQRTSCNATPCPPSRSRKHAPRRQWQKGPFPCWPLSLVQTPIRLLCDPKTGAMGRRTPTAFNHSLSLSTTFCHRKQRSFVIAPLNQSIIHRCSLAGFGYRQRLSRDKHGISSVEALGNPLKSLISAILDIIS